MWISLEPKRAAKLILLLACTCSSALMPFNIVSAAPPNPKGIQRSGTETDFHNDLRLRERCSEEQVGGPLKNYLAGLSELADVRLKVESPIVDSGFTALNVNTEAGRLLKGIARVYHLSWAADPGSGVSYTLREGDLDRKRRLEAHSIAMRKGAIKANARWDNVRRLASKSDRELKTLASKGDAMAQSLLHPRGRTMAQLVYGLPPALLSEMWNRGSVQIPLAQLPQNLQQLAATFKSTGTFSVANTDTGLPVELEKPDPSTLRLEIGGTVDRPTVFATITHGYHGVKANLLYAEAVVRQPPSERREARVPRKIDFLPGHPLMRTVTLRDPASRVGLERGERPLKAVPLAKLLKDLANQGVPPIISACDYQPKNKEWLATQWWLGSDIVDQRLHKALDLICADFEYEWEYRDGMVLLWPSRWYVAE